MEENQVKTQSLIEKQAGYAFSLATVLPLFLVSIISFMFAGKTESEVFRVVATVFSILANVGVIVILGIGKKPVLKTFSVNKFNLKYLLIALGLFYGSFFALSYFNGTFIGLLQKAGLKFNPVAVPLSTPTYFILSLILLGVLTPVVEELIFRGAVLKGLSSLKPWAQILISGALFALFHKNPAQTVYPFISGCIFSLITLKSGSIIPAVIMHVLNNILVLICEYFFAGVDIYNYFTVISGAIIFVISLVFLILDKAKVQKTNGNIKEFFVGSAIGIVFCAISWVVALF